MRGLQYPDPKGPGLLYPDPAVRGLLYPDPKPWSFVLRMNGAQTIISGGKTRLQSPGLICITLLINK